jgi:hypothetical protein
VEHAAHRRDEPLDADASGRKPSDPDFAEMSVWRRVTSRFYATGCGLTGMSTEALDEAIAAKAKARYGDNHLTVTWPDGRKIYHHVHIGNRTRAAKWVHTFNNRAGT